jgi:hypothetical protein
MLLYFSQMLAAHRSVPADVVRRDVLLALDQEEFPREVHGVETLLPREDFLEVEKQLNKLAIFFVLSKVERQTELVDAVFEEDASGVDVEREVCDGLLDSFEVGVEHVPVDVSYLCVAFRQLPLDASSGDSAEDDAADDADDDEGDGDLHPVEGECADDANDESEECASVSAVFDYVVPFLREWLLRSLSRSPL